MKTKSPQASLTFGMGLVMLISTLLGCTPGMERQIQTAAAGSGATLAVGLQTQAVIAGQTAVAGGVKMVETQAALLQKTGEARLKTEAARLSTEVGRALTPSFQAGGQAILDYFALGDSIAAGHGLMDDMTECHRSIQAYPYQLKTLLEQRYAKVNLYPYACSGATAGEPSSETLRKDKFKWFRRQVDETLLHLSNRPTLITITIGANDLSWTDWKSYLKNMCLPSTVYWDWIAEVRARVSGELYEQIQRLVKGRPNVSILLTEVHNPVNKKNSIFLSLPLCGDILGVLNDYERTHYMVTELSNGYFSDVWVKLGSPSWMRVVPIMAMFDAHAAPRPKCGDGDPDTNNTWIQYPGGPNTNGEVPYFMEKVLTGEKYGDCFHPNKQGAEAIAKRAYEYVTAVGK